MSLAKSPVVSVTMLIRRPIEEVFAAFVDPAITSKFWFSRSSGPLRVGETVTWHWDRYRASADVVVKAVDRPKRIEIEWPDPVEWLFEAGSEGTLVRITAKTFSGTDDEIVGQALDYTQGFNLVIAGCKAYLEHGIELNLVNDKDPSRL